MSIFRRASGNHVFFNRRLLLLTFALLVWLFFLVRATQVFTISSTHVGWYSSDTAIVVLMANQDQPLNTFDTYYYGQDRFGAWPFLLPQIIHHLTNYHWSSRSIFIIQSVWLFIGVLLLSTMSRRVDVMVGLLFLLPLCLDARVSRFVFALSLTYGWQITAFIFSWWSLRCFVGHCFRTPKSNHQVIKSIAWALPTFWFALLAIMSSPVSGPVLVFLATLEVLRSMNKSRSSGAVKSIYEERVDHTNSRQWPSRIYVRVLYAALPIAAAVVIELLLKAHYHSNSLKRFGNDFKTPVALDTGHLTENLVVQSGLFRGSPWWLFSLLPLLVFALLSARDIYFFRNDKERLRESLTKLFLEDDAILVIAAFGIGVINFILTVLVSHTRVMQYAPTYLTLSHLFISFSGLMTLLLMARRMKRYGRAASYAISLGALTILLIWFPKSETNPQYPPLMKTAVDLSQKAPSRVLLGGFWETYVFAGLDPKGVLIAVPAEGQYVRIPWSIDAIKRSDLVIVEHGLEFERSRNIPAPDLGTAETPKPYLVQYGVPLRLINPRWYVNDRFVFSLYRNEASKLYRNDIK
jgi:hypothetical protein